MQITNKDLFNLKKKKKKKKKEFLHFETAKHCNLLFKVLGTSFAVGR